MSHSPLGLPASASSMTPCERSLRPPQLTCEGGRAAARIGTPAATGALSLRLPLRTPFAYEGVFGHLAATAVPGCEEVRDGAYRRTLRLPSGSGIVSLTPTPDHVRCLLVVDDFRDVSAAIARCRRLLDLDADPRRSSRR